MKHLSYDNKMTSTLNSADKKTCSSCRHDLGEDYEPTVNTNLKAVLNSMFPGYEVGR